MRGIPNARLRSLADPSDQQLVAGDRWRDVETPSGRDLSPLLANIPTAAVRAGLGMLAPAED
jgi:hypothetical protein